MSLLTVNGVAVSVLRDEGGHSEPTIIGSEARSFNGSLIGDIRAVKENLHYKTPPHSQAEDIALRGLLQGLGHSFSYDSDTYSGKGLGTSAGAGNSNVASTPTPKWGAKCLKTTDYASYTTGFTTWTMMVWRLGPSTTWEHWLVTSADTPSAPARYKNGAVSTDAYYFMRGTPGKTLLSETNAWTNVSGGGSWQVRTYNGSSVFLVADYTVQATGLGYNALYQCTVSSGATDAGDIDFTDIGNGQGFGETTAADSNSGARFINAGRIRTSGNTYGAYDDFVILPYAVPSSWVSQLYAEMSARAWTPNPNVRVAGDMVSSAPLTMKGKLADSKTLGAGFTSSWNNNLEQLEFLLRQV